MIRHCEALFPVRPGNLGQGNQPKQSPSRGHAPTWGVEEFWWRLLQAVPSQ